LSSRIPATPAASDSFLNKKLKEKNKKQLGWTPDQRLRSLHIPTVSKKPEFDHLQLY
jgi:hypothetical protein